MRVVFEIDMIKANSKVAILFNNEKSMVMSYFEKKIVICIKFITPIVKSSATNCSSD